MTTRKTFRKVITSDERTAQINKESMTLMEQFLQNKSTRTSPKTIEIYRSNLTIFLTWNLLYNNNKTFTDIKKIEFSNFFVYATNELKIGSSRQNNIRSTLSSFSTFIERFYDEEYPHFRNVILAVIESSPKEVRREKTILTDEQVQQLLDYYEKEDSQKACLIALATCSGARVSELINWELDLIDEKNTAFGDIFLETTRKIKTKGRGRGGKLIYKYILKDTFLPYYHAWLKERKERLEKLGVEEHNFLFIKANGEPGTLSMVDLWTAEFGKIIGEPVYMHAFRHYLTTLLARKKVPDVFIKELFGWESADMVDIYKDITIKDLDWSEELDLLKTI